MPDWLQLVVPAAFAALIAQQWWMIKTVIRVDTMVSRNGHADSGKPTLRDEVADVKAGVGSLGTKFDAHVEWAEAESKRGWAEHEHVKKRLTKVEKRRWLL